MHRRHRRAATRRPLANYWAEPETAGVLAYHVSVESDDLQCLTYWALGFASLGRDEMRLLPAEDCRHGMDGKLRGASAGNSHGDGPFGLAR